MPTDVNFPTTNPIPSRFVYLNRYSSQGGGWQVGLSAISLPDARVNLYELVKKNGYVMGVDPGTKLIPNRAAKDGEMITREWDTARTHHQ